MQDELRRRVRGACERLGPGVVKAADVAADAEVSPRGIGQVLKALGYKRLGRGKWDTSRAASA